ncbi:hypothetical protein LCGC14_1343080 [marine sediment metagenome]|uniref:DNA-directed DNA polymerase n=1 Tax=marine sediment metagenome TaxID=412755 RepID=A0A0F9NFH1_9ZZZZ
MSTTRSILHLDMDAFFAAVEQRDHPELKGKPLLIGHDGPRGVVATASYEARSFGCHSAQPMVTAKRRCPDAIILPVRGQRYQEVSEQMSAILDEFSPLVEPISIDEAFIDLTGTERLLGKPEDVARRMKARIRSVLELTASVGVSFNKFLAKLASDMDKPDGLTIIRPEDVDRILSPLPVTKLFGIGKITGEKLAKVGIKTVGDLRQKPLEWLRVHLGSEAQGYFNLARGVDDRPLTPDREAQSIGHERTFEVDVANPDEIRRVLFDQVEQVARRLRKHGLRARGVSLKIRFGDFETIGRSTTLTGSTNITTELWQAARGLFDKWPFRPVRLIGITAERLTETKSQLTLFDDPGKERQEKLDSVTDRINEKYGEKAIGRGGKS